MGKIKYIGDEDRTLPGLGHRLVVPGQVVEVDDADVYGYTCQSIWEPADPAAKKAHKEAESPAEDEAAAAVEEV